MKIQRTHGVVTTVHYRVGAKAYRVDIQHRHGGTYAVITPEQSSAHEGAVASAGKAFTAVVLAVAGLLRNLAHTGGGGTGVLAGVGFPIMNWLLGLVLIVVGVSCRSLGGTRTHPVDEEHA